MLRASEIGYVYGSWGLDVLLVATSFQPPGELQFGGQIGTSEI